MGFCRISQKKTPHRPSAPTGAHHSSLAMEGVSEDSQIPLLGLLAAVMDRTHVFDDGATLKALRATCRSGRNIVASKARYVTVKVTKPPSLFHEIGSIVIAQRCLQVMPALVRVAIRQVPFSVLWATRRAETTYHIRPEGVQGSTTIQWPTAQFVHDTLSWTLWNNLGILLSHNPRRHALFFLPQ